MSSPSPIPIAVFGAAHGHVGSYCAQWRGRPELGVRPAAVWDHDAARAEAFGEAHRAEVVGDRGALLARPDVAAVVIGAETSLHAELVEQAAEAGKAIILQKPIALTINEADRIVSAVSRTGVAFTLAWQMRVDPQNLRMKAMMEDGVVGRVYVVRRRHGLATHAWGEGFESSWHVKPELNRGMWADDAAHAADFLLWMLGAPETVIAEIDTLRTPKVPDDHGVAVFRYPDGRFAQIDSSFCMTAGQTTTEIIGERGVIVQDFGDAPSCTGAKAHQQAGLKWRCVGDSDWTYADDLPSPESHGQRIAALADPLAAFLRGERPPVATAAEGRDALRMILASHRSAELGRRVRLDEL